MPNLAPLRRVYDVEPPTPSAGDPISVEEALLGQMRRLLDAHAAPAVDAATLEAIQRRAAEASQRAKPLHEAYAATAPLAGEAEVLRQSRLALDEAFAARPAPDLPAQVEGRILARAAEASALARGPAPDDVALAPVAAAYGLADAEGPEATLLGTTRDALDRLPTVQPDRAALDAVLAQAALASAPARPSTPTHAPDRAAAPLVSRRRVGGVWVGSAALLAAAVIAVIVLPFGGAETEPTFAEATAQTDAAPTEVADAEASEPRAESGAPAPPVENAPAAALAAAAPATVAPIRRSAPRGPSASDALTPVRAERAPALARSRTASPDDAVQEAIAAPGLADAVLSDREAMPGWEVEDDVRILSLRLQELRRQNQGLAWDEPAEAFGAAPAAGVVQPGVQVVREGSAPARAQLRVRSDSARSDSARSNR